MFKVFFLIHIEIRRVILSSDFELFQNNDFSGVKSENVSQVARNSSTANSGIKRIPSYTIQTLT